MSGPLSDDERGAGRAENILNAFVGFELNERQRVRARELIAEWRDESEARGEPEEKAFACLADKMLRYFDALDGNLRACSCGKIHLDDRCPNCGMY